METPVREQQQPSASLLVVITYSMNPLLMLNVPQLRRLPGIRVTALVDRLRQPAFECYEPLFDCVSYIDIDYRDHCFIERFPVTAEDVVAPEVTLCSQLVIMSFCEGDIEATAELRNRFNLPGMSPSAVEKFRDKMLMKQIISEIHDVPRAVALDWKLPTSDLFSLCSDTLGIPFIVKPTELCGSLGVVEVSMYEEFDATCLRRVADDYMAEEKISGDLLHLDVVVASGTVRWFGCSQYNLPLDRFLHGSAIGSIPLLPEDPWHIRLRDYATSVAQSFSVGDAILHIEVFRRGDHLLFLEAAARPSGGLISVLYEKMFGYNMYQAAVEGRMGLDYEPMATDGRSYFWLLLPPDDVNTCRKLRDCGIPFELYPGGTGLQVPGSLIGAYDRVLASHDDYHHLYRSFMAVA
jgi:hypothetical protein